MSGQNLPQVAQILQNAITQRGATLVALSEASPLLVLFLRHAGCTFCREALADIARSRLAIQAAGIRIILVHMGDTGEMEKLIAKYGLSSLDRICDRDQTLYRAFGLKRGKLWQLFGPEVLVRAFFNGVLPRHGIGRPKADSFQMPGLFLIDGSTIVRRVRHRSAADRPDYAAVCALPAGTGGGL